MTPTGTYCTSLGSFIQEDAFQLEMVKRAICWTKNNYSPYNNVTDAAITWLEVPGLQKNRSLSFCALQYYTWQHCNIAIPIPTYFKQSKEVTRRSQQFIVKSTLPSIFINTLSFYWFLCNRTGYHFLQSCCKNGLSSVPHSGLLTTIYLTYHGTDLFLI